MNEARRRKRSTDGEASLDEPDLKEEEREQPSSILEPPSMPEPRIAEDPSLGPPYATSSTQQQQCTGGAGTKTPARLCQSRYVSYFESFHFEDRRRLTRHDFFVAIISHFFI